jgi:hypothetical protein
MPTLNIKGFPEELYYHLVKRAKQDHRSVTGEVIYLLEWALGSSQKGKTSILQLRGLGKELWKSIDASQHVDEERTSWE